MNAEVKKCADEQNIKGLRYIFDDCLDVDPTFESYKEEYDYCKRIPGFLEPFTELTPFEMNPAKWDENYWVKLKMDLIKNFSEERFMHMVNVAKVYKADKIHRLQQEREANDSAGKEPVHMEPVQKTAVREQPVQRAAVLDPERFNREEEERVRRELEENQRIFHAEIEREAKAKAERQQKAAEEQNRRMTEEKARVIRNASEESISKKAVGAVLIIAVVIAVIILMFILR